MNSDITRQLIEAGFERAPKEDFSDDGTNFYVYQLEGTLVSYARAADLVFLYIKADYGKIPYNIYHKFPTFGLADQFNGVDEDKVDVAQLVKNLQAINKEIQDFNNGKQVIKTNVDEMTQLELKNFLKMEYLPYHSDDRTDKVFRLAWDYGHASGHHEVKMYYSEMAELVK